MRGRTADGVPVFGYPRGPGVPPVAVGRLPARDRTLVRSPGPHAHDFLVVLYAHRADGQLVVDGRSRLVHDGDVFVVAPGQVVSPDEAAHGAVADGWVVFFPADVVGELSAGALTSWRTHPLLFPFAHDAATRTRRLRVPPAERAAWVGRYAALDDELRARRDGYRDAVLAHLTLLLVALSRLSVDVGGELRAVNEPVLAAVFDVVDARFAEPLSLADVAAELNLSAGHLTTVVRRKTGRTVQQWITERRMQAARRLLHDTDLPVATVGRRVGYTDVGYFTRRFRAAHGTAPGAWRRAGTSTAGRSSTLP